MKRRSRETFSNDEKEENDRLRVRAYLSMHEAAKLCNVKMLQKQTTRRSVVTRKGEQRSGERYGPGGEAYGGLMGRYAPRARSKGPLFQFCAQ